MMNGDGRRALFELIADELRLGLRSASGLDPASRSELLGLVDDLVEVAGGHDDESVPGDMTPFDPIYRAANE